MKIAMIVAMSPDRVIGLNGCLPWHLPADLAYFKKVTLGAPVLMGRKTYESLLVKPLPGRRNIIVSRNPDFSAPGCVKAADLDAAIVEASDAPRLFVIGGATLYEQMLDRADELFITCVDVMVEGDTFFPHVDMKHWQEQSRSVRAPDSKNPYAMEFIQLSRMD